MCTLELVKGISMSASFNKAYLRALAEDKMLDKSVLFPK